MMNVAMMSGIGMDLLAFAIGAGIVWIIFRRKEAVEEPVKALELDYLSSQDPTVDGQPFEQFERWFRHQILLSQISLNHRTLPLLMLVASAIVAASVLFLTDNPLVAGILAVGVLLIAMAVLVAIAKYRVRQFRKQLPLALDIMARAVRSGDGMREAVSLLSQTMEEPARTEFIRVRNQMDMGLSLRSTMQSFADRIGSLDARLFATTLAVHRDTGGELSGTLERMALVIRSRFEYERHMQATTGMGRMSAMIVISLAWLILAYMMVMKPEYAADLWEKPLGQQMLMVALTLEIVGIVWVLALMKSDY